MSDEKTKRTGKEPDTQRAHDEGQAEAETLGGKDLYEAVYWYLKPRDREQHDRAHARITHSNATRALQRALKQRIIRLHAPRAKDLQKDLGRFMSSVDVNVVSTKGLTPEVVRSAIAAEAAQMLRDRAEKAWNRSKRFVVGLGGGKAVCKVVDHVGRGALEREGVKTIACALAGVGSGLQHNVTFSANLAVEMLKWRNWSVEANVCCAPAMKHVSELPRVRDDALESIQTTVLSYLEETGNGRAARWYADIATRDFDAIVTSIGDFQPGTVFYEEMNQIASQLLDEIKAKGCAGEVLYQGLSDAGEIVTYGPFIALPLQRMQILAETDRAVVVCAMGAHLAASVVAAWKAKLMNVLIVDEDLGEALRQLLYGTP